MLISPFISVVTRTRNREIMLMRLMENLSKQKFKNFEWVIVNDAGYIVEVERIIDLAKKNQLNVQLVNNVVSNGRSAAANIGVKKSTGKYVIILDDDDFPNQDYFQKVHNFFEMYPKYRGVACWAEVTLEKISGKNIINCGVENTYRPAPDDLSILSLHTANIPPCSLVLDKEIFLRVGGYPEDIDCTEDWACICNFVLQANIGVIPEVLVYYSKRIDPDGFYKNTTSDRGGVYTHLRDEVVWKNNRIRNSIKCNDISGIVPMLGSINMKIQDIRITLNRLESVQATVDGLQRKIDHANNELCVIYHSNSWRLTAPLRYLVKCIKKIKHKIVT